MSPAERGEPLASDLDAVLTATGGLWDDLRGARLFVTGGTGFFGCWLLETLLHADEALRLGISAVVLSRDPQRFAGRVPYLAESPAVTLLEGDMASFAFPTGSFDAVIHAATETGDPTAPVADRLADPLQKFDSDLAGVRRALELARERELRSLAVPAIGAGSAGLPLQRCAEVLIEEARGHLAGETSLEEIRFVLLGEPAYRVFEMVHDAAKIAEQMARLRPAGRGA